ncbi:MAG: hypothetical protein K2N25_09465 [Muribaculaceae bacterium]|nr:hypothetical protein [Muribaculaceae bacterium]
MTVSGSIAIPDMPVMHTRGAFGDTPNNGLKLTVLEFDLAVTAAQSFITNVYQAELKTVSGVANEGVVTFDITLKAAATPKVLHFMIADDFVSVPADGGSVASLLPSLSVGNQTSHPEAYWGYVEFPNGFSKVDADNNVVLRDDVKTKLANIPVIRNFAKITVTNSTANFELLGFDVVSCPTSGTIAPWNTSKQEIPALLSKTGDVNAMKSYSEISASSEPEIPGLPYSGIIPDNVGFYNQEAQAKNWVDGDNSNMRSTRARYLYEHPYESTRRTYIIVNGNYTSTNNGTTTTTRGFYKIDIGNIKDDGTFDYYNIIRNINYNIIINNVYAPGTETVAQAIERAPFNNLLASTETSSMLNVSDGNNMLIVNDVNHVIVNDGSEVKILYRYITDVTGNKTQDNSIPKYIVGEGDVIKKNTSGDYEISEATYREPAPSTTEWVELTVKTNDPDEYQTKEQTVTIVDGNGLGRTITLILHKPWNYSIISGNGVEYTATVKPEAPNYYGTAIIPATAVPEVSNAAGAEFTVYFNLPDGLPDSIFPLDFTLEAKYQGVENNKKGTMLVTSGTSLFDPNVTAIQYIKSVSLNEYKYQYNGTDDSNGFDTGKANTSHTIRCRFTSISAVNNNSDGVIRIYNEYFVNPKFSTADDSTADPKKSQCAEVQFKRVTSPNN